MILSRASLVSVYKWFVWCSIKCSCSAGSAHAVVDVLSCFLASMLWNTVSCWLVTKMKKNRSSMSSLLLTTFDQTSLWNSVFTFFPLPLTFLLRPPSVVVESAHLTDIKASSFAVNAWNTLLTVQSSIIMGSVQLHSFSIHLGRMHPYEHLTYHNPILRGMNRLQFSLLVPRKILFGIFARAYSQLPLLPKGAISLGWN